jgi:hypothetical protein
VTEVVTAFKGRRAWRQHQQAAERAPTRRYPVCIARQLERGEFPDFADMARQLGFTRARVTQLMDLLLLAPEV